MKRTLIGSFFCSAALACSHLPELKPDAGAARAPGNPNLALAEVSGVRVIVSGDAWKGEPRNLAEIFTPVKVTIENQSSRALKVNYQEFALKGASGFAYAAIPPLQAYAPTSRAPRASLKAGVAYVSYQPEGAEKGPAVQQQSPPPRFAPRIYHDRFFVAPHLSWYYPGWAPWVYPFPYDPLYYDRFYGYWSEPLPTRDMLAEALPAGAVQNGGHVTGFLYFQGVGSRESRVTFQMDLVDASNNQAFGQVSIPFVVNK